MCRFWTQLICEDSETDMRSGGTVHVDSSLDSPSYQSWTYDLNQKPGLIPQSTVLGIKNIDIKLRLLVPTTAAFAATSSFTASRKLFHKLVLLTRPDFTPAGLHNNVIEVHDKSPLNNKNKRLLLIELCNGE